MISSTVESLHTHVRTRVYGPLEIPKLPGTEVASRPNETGAALGGMHERLNDIDEAMEIPPQQGDGIAGSLAASDNQPLLGLEGDLDIFGTNAELTDFDWEAVAATFDLPSY